MTTSVSMTGNYDDSVPVLRPGTWLRFKHAMPYRLRHVLAWAERLASQRRGLKIWLDGRAVYCAPNTAPVFAGLGPDHDEDRLMMRRVFDTLAPGDVFLDVGSHFGLYSIGAALRVGDRGRVLAFEPTPSTVEKLKRNIGINGLTARIEVHPIAVSDQEGVAEFAVNGTSMMNSLYCEKRQGGQVPAGTTEHVQVITRTLDEFFQQGTPTTAKIDTEGAELAVLRGASKLLASDARIFLELHPWAWSSEQEGWQELQQLAAQANRVVCGLNGEPLEGPRFLRTELVRNH